MSRKPCGKPVALPIRSHKVQGISSSKRGVAIQYGTPGQQLILGADSYHNGVTVAKAPVDQSNCNDDFTQERCIWNKGGIFDTSASSTFKGGPGNGKDTLQINTSIQLREFPADLESRTSGTSAKSPHFGVGPSSEAMNQLYASKNIPSKVFSIDVGRTGRIESDGELLFGGYNKKRLRGKFEDMHEFSIAASSEKCQYQVTVRRITMIGDNGDRTVMFGNSGANAMSVCLQPRYTYIGIPDSIFRVFNEKMGRLYDTMRNSNRDRGEISLWTYSVPRDQNFKGSLEVETTDGLKVAIPNDQLVRDTLRVDDDGNVVSDKDKTTLLISSDPDDGFNDLPIFGMPFLSSLYMSVDSNRKKFWLGPSAYGAVGDNDYALLPGSEVSDCSPPPGKAPTKSTDNANEEEPSKSVPASSQKEEGPKPTDGSGSEDDWDVDDSVKWTDVNKVDPSPDKSPGGSSAIDGSTDPNASRSEPSGVIIGSAVAGGVALILFIAALILFFRRRKVHRHSPSSQSFITATESEDGMKYGSFPRDGSGPGGEMRESRRNTVVHEIAPPPVRYEMATPQTHNGFSRGGMSVYEVPVEPPVSEIAGREVWSPPNRNSSTSAKLHYSNSVQTARMSASTRGNPQPTTAAQATMFPPPPEYSSLVCELDTHPSPRTGGSVCQTSSELTRTWASNTSSAGGSTGTGRGYIIVAIEESPASESGR